MTEPGAIRLERDIPHPPALVWQAITEPAFVSRWWATGDIRPDVGHAFTLDMGAFGSQQCVVKAVEPGQLFAYDFGVGMLDTTITWELEPTAEGTHVRFEHAGFNLDSEMGRQALGGMSAGWPKILNQLAGVVDELSSTLGV